jgi:hypothetical protein
MNRRGEVPFVAIPVGQSNDPREVLGLARELKISRATALGYVALWQEMILERGDAMTGTLKGYSPMHVAEKLGYEGSPKKLLEAMKRAGWVTSHRGTFKFPGWKQSATGEYAKNRAERREWERWRKAEQRRKQREAELAGDGGQNNVQDVPGDVPGTTVGRPTPVPWEGVHKERKESVGQPPQPPAERGEGRGYARWRWVLENHQRPTNPEPCVKLLDAMPDEDWPLFQWVSLAPEAGGPRSSSRKKRVLELDSHQILVKRAYLQFRREWDAKLREAERPKGGTSRPAAPKADPAAAGAARAASALTFVLAQLADETSEAKKAAIQARFAKLHPDVPVPWAPEVGGLPAAESTA